MTSIYKIILLLTFVVAVFTISGQNQTVFGKYNVMVANEAGKTPPQFPGGKDSLKIFVFKNLNIQGKGTCSHPNNIRVQFNVEQNGEITNIKYLKPGDAEAYIETIRFIKSMPKWVPATKNDSLTKSTVTLQFYR